MDKDDPVVCPKCGAKHFLLYGNRFRCPCGHEGPFTFRDRSAAEQ